MKHDNGSKSLNNSISEFAGYNRTEHSKTRSKSPLTPKFSTRRLPFTNSTNINSSNTRSFQLDNLPNPNSFNANVSAFNTII